MFKVYYQMTNHPIFVAKLDTEEEARQWIIDHNEIDMIESAEEGFFEGMDDQERWEFYNENLNRYAVVKSNESMTEEMVKIINELGYIK